VRAGREGWREGGRTYRWVEGHEGADGEGEGILESVGVVGEPERGREGGREGGRARG